MSEFDGLDMEPTDVDYVNTFPDEEDGGAAQVTVPVGGYASSDEFREEKTERPIDFFNNAELDDKELALLDRAQLEITGTRIWKEICRLASERRKLEPAMIDFRENDVLWRGYDRILKNTGASFWKDGAHDKEKYVKEMERLAVAQSQLTRRVTQDDLLSREIERLQRGLSFVQSAMKS
jgi:hypothetical protein